MGLQAPPWRVPLLGPPADSLSLRSALVGSTLTQSWTSWEREPMPQSSKGSPASHALVALKEIRLEHEEGAPCTAIREVSLLKDLKHNNIVTLHDIVHTEKSLTLVFEYLERDLKQYMDDCGGILAMNNVKIFLFQLIRG